MDNLKKNDIVRVKELGREVFRIETIEVMGEEPIYTIIRWSNNIPLRGDDGERMLFSNDDLVKVRPSKVSTGVGGNCDV